MSYRGLLLTRVLSCTSCTLCSHRQYVAPPDEPHAFAEEDEPIQSKKSPAPKAISPKPTPSISYQESDDRPVGPDHQAGIPALRRRPAQPTPSEAKFLQIQPLHASDQLDAGSSADRAASAAAFEAQYQAAPDAAAKRALLDAAVQQLDARMGPDMVQASNTRCCCGTAHCCQ